jgi:hypothetical protein
VLVSQSPHEIHPLQWEPHYQFKPVCTYLLRKEVRQVNRGRSMDRNAPRVFRLGMFESTRQQEGKTTRKWHRKRAPRYPCTHILASSVTPCSQVISSSFKRSISVLAAWRPFPTAVPKYLCTTTSTFHSTCEALGSTESCPDKREMRDKTTRETTESCPDKREIRDKTTGKQQNLVLTKER